MSCSVSDDGGERWHPLGQLYRAPAGALHRPGYLCGYPDLLYTGADGQGDLACVLHTYPDAQGRMELRWLRLHDAA